MVRKRVLCLLLCILCLVSTACASGSTSLQPSVSTQPTTISSPQPTATSLPAGTVLYQANWTQGLSQWQPGSGWNVAQGQLEVKANDLSQIIIPYRPHIHNYVIEVRLEVVRLLRGEAGYWTIFGQRQPGKDGFQAEVLGVKGTEPRMSGSHGAAQILLDPVTAMAPGIGIPNDYDPGFQWHTYTVEVQDNGLRFRDNGIQIGYASSVDAYYLSNGPLGLSCQWLDMRVSSIQILSL